MHTLRSRSGRCLAYKLQTEEAEDIPTKHRPHMFVLICLFLTVLVILTSGTLTLEAKLQHIESLQGSLRGVLRVSGGFMGVPLGLSRVSQQRPYACDPGDQEFLSCHVEAWVTRKIGGKEAGPQSARSGLPAPQNSAEPLGF